MRYLILAPAVFVFSTLNAYPQTIQDRLKTLEAQVAELQKQIQDLKRETATAQASQEGLSAESPTQATNREFSEQIVVPDLGGNERDHELEGKPDIFLQTRFARNFVHGADARETEQNFDLTRIEVRWSGSVQISERKGRRL